MPCAVDYILDGLANNLELERELGSFAIEFDREFLTSLPKEREEKAEPKAKPKVAVPKSENRFDFVFLHHAAMTGPSAEMMANVITKGLGKTPETAPIVFGGERPPAKIYVVLGAKALDRWYEGLSLANGGWFKDVDSKVFYTWSPEDIFRFGTNLTPAMKQKKMDMWKGLQEGMRKIYGQ